MKRTKPKTRPRARLIRKLSVLLTLVRLLPLWSNNLKARQNWRAENFRNSSPLLIK